MAHVVFFAAILAACSARAADTGDSVVILINSASADSEEIGAYYAKRRGVPGQNICRIACRTSETISRAEFETQVRQPLRRFLLESGLATQPAPDGPLQLKVKYLVSTYGVPVKIREDYADAKLAELPRGIHDRTAAAVDSELALIALPAYPLKGWVENPMLSKGGSAPVLFATRLDGPTPAIAKGLVDAAIDAETHGLFGLAYIDTRGITDGPYALGDKWLSSAGSALNSAGFFIRADRSPETFDPAMPMPDAAFYFGWYNINLCGPMADDGFRFARGAVAYHIHSGSAVRLRTTTVGWAGPLLGKGAAATMGAVFEPYLNGTVDVAEFVRLFLAGNTFGESCWRATATASWMMTFVGDPLYAPFRQDARAKALADPGNRNWRDLAAALAAADGARFAECLDLCSAHNGDPLFVELAARVQFRAGRPDEAVKLFRRLGGLLKDDYSSIQAESAAGDWFAQSGQFGPALDSCLDVVRRHPASPHALPVYRRALGLARGLRQAETETALWEALAANFPRHALGRFAAAELWVRGLRETCPVPRIIVPRADPPPVIDGRVDDLAWKGAALTELMSSSSAWPRKVVTKVRLCCSDAALFVLAELPSPPHPGSAEDDAFVVELSPWRDAQRSVRVVVRNAPQGGDLPKGVKCQVEKLWIQRDSVKTEAGWTVEMEIPFAALGLEPPGKRGLWAANFVREGTMPAFPFRSMPVAVSWATVDSGSTMLAPESAGYLIFK